MFRLIASTLIALVAISSSLAHAYAGMTPTVAEVSGHSNAPHHSHAEMMGDRGDNAPTTHEDHGGTCVLEHCATACGVILPFFETVACVTLTAVRNEYTEQTFVGLISTSDPPPPKT